MCFTNSDLFTHLSKTKIYKIYICNKIYHYVKSVRIRSFSGPCFPAFGLNTERYEVYLRTQSECGKIRTRKTPNADTFHAIYIAVFNRCVIRLEVTYKYTLSYHENRLNKNLKVFASRKLSSKQFLQKFVL